MGIFDRIAGLLVPSPPSIILSAGALAPVLEPNDVSDEAVMRALTINPTRTSTMLLGNIRGGQAPRRGTAELMLAYNRLPHLRSVVGRIVQAVAQVEWRVYRVASKTTQRALSTKSFVGRQKAIATSDMVELEQHPFLDLMERFNPEMGGVAGRKLMQIFLDLKGDSFTIIERRGGVTGDPIELWPVPPHMVNLPTTINGPFEVNSYRGVRGDVAREQMLYIRELDPHEPLMRGSGIGESLADELDADEFAGKHLKSWFLNRGIPSMLIGIEDAEPDEVKVARQDWEERNRGPLRNNRVHFHNGKLNAVRLDDKFSDMEIVDLREFAMRVVRETYNVPPELVGHLDNSNRSTIEEALAIMAILVVQPRLELLRTEMQAQLVPLFDDGETLVIDYCDPVPADRKGLLEAAKAAPWSLSMNEWRALQSAPPIDNGDDIHLVNGTLINLASGKKSDAVTLNELTLGIERLGALGDAAGINALRDALADRLGVTLPPVEIEPMGPAPAPATEEPKSLERAGSAGMFRLRTKTLSTAQIDDVVAAIDSKPLDKHMTPVVEKTANHFGRAMTAEAEALKAWEPKADAMVDYLANFSAKKIKDIDDTTRSRIRSVLIESVAAGDKTPTIARKLREKFDEMEGGRARTVARTEVYTAANFARHLSLVNEGILLKRWVTTIDGRERAAHHAMNGQTVEVGKTFVAPSGARARFPGGFRSAGLNVNCRCVVVGVKAAKDAPDFDAVWRAFDREAARWEQKMSDAFVKALREQERAVLTALESAA